MNRVFRTVIIPLGDVETILAVAPVYGAARFAFAWTVTAGPVDGEATHWVTSGMVPEELVQALLSSDALRTAVPHLSPEQAQAALSEIDVSEEDGHAAMARAGLVPVLTGEQP
jgi:hypothetical protein